MAHAVPNGEALGDFSREEFAQMLEDYARRFVGMSLGEFFERLERGALPDTFAVEDLKTLTGVAAAGA